MTFTVHGPDAFFHLIAALCFLIAAIAAWFAPGHRAGLTLACAGLFFWVLTALVH